MCPVFREYAAADEAVGGGSGPGDVVPSGADAVFTSAPLPCFGAEGIVFHVHSSDPTTVTGRCTTGSKAIVVEDRDEAAGLLALQTLTGAKVGAAGTTHIDSLAAAGTPILGGTFNGDLTVGVPSVGTFIADDPIAGVGIPAGTHVDAVTALTRVGSADDDSTALRLCGLTTRTGAIGRLHPGQGVSGAGIDSGTVLESVGIVRAGLFKSGAAFVGFADRALMDGLVAGCGAYAHDFTSAVDHEWIEVSAVGQDDVVDLVVDSPTFTPTDPELYPVGVEVWGEGLPFSTHVIANDGTDVTLNLPAMFTQLSAAIHVAGVLLAADAVDDGTADIEFAMVTLSKQTTAAIVAGTISFAAITLSAAATATAEGVEVYLPCVLTAHDNSNADGSDTITVTGSDFDSEDIEFNNSLDGTGAWVSHAEVNGDIVGTLVAKRLGANGRPVSFFATAGQFVGWRLARLKATVANGQPGVPGLTCTGFVSVNEGIALAKPALLPMNA